MEERTIIVQAYDWENEDVGERVNVLSWCLDEESNCHLVRIPYYYVCYWELNSFVVMGRITEWKPTLIPPLMSHVCQIMKDSAPCSWSFEGREKLYYYQGEKKFPMVRLVFTSQANLNYFKNIAKKPITFPVENAKRRITLRATGKIREDRHSATRRLLTERNCRYAQWYEIKVRRPQNHIISSISEWIGDYRTLNPRPDIKIVTKPKVLSFDIECYSDNHKAMPKEYIPQHVVYMISCIVFRCGSPEREKYLIVTGDIQLEGVEVINVKTEKELCDAFASLILRVNPDMITGFNIFGFDYPYLYSRLGLYNRSWRNISRKVDVKNDLREINWKSSAYSRQHYYMMSAQGRINFDLYTLVRREMKLLRYNLDSVAKENLGRGKHDVSAVEMFSIFERYMQNREKYKKEFTRVAEYCMEDSLLVVDLIEKLNVWIWLTEFSSVTGVSVADLFIRGQQVRCYSLLQDLTIKKGIVMDSVPKPPASKYQGAYVSEPVPGLYNFVVCLDFNSLYPNIMRAYNMCYTTLVRPEDEKELVKIGLTLDDVHVIEWEEIDEKTGEKKNFRNLFVKEHVKKGLFPELLTNLIDSRNMAKAEMKKFAEGTLGYKVADKKQLGFKVVANSGYGFTGATQGFLPCKAIASSVTAMGRKHIQECNNYLSTKYGYTIVYNDTDSVFFAVNASSYAEAWKIGKNLEKEVSDIFPSYLRLEMEKTGLMFCIKKKMYAFWPVDAQGNFQPRSKIMHKGTTLNRRDNCTWQREFFEAVLMGCLEKMSAHDMYSLICEECINLYRRTRPFPDFIIVKAVGEEYKNKYHPMAIFMEKMAERGCPITPGDRIDYIITDVQTKYVGDKMVAPEHFLQDECKVDYDYYLEHFGMKKIEKLFNIAHKEIIEESEAQHDFTIHYMALHDFLSKHPEYREELGRIAKEDDSPQEMYNKLFSWMKDNRIGKLRTELQSYLSKRRLRKAYSYLSSKPVKQQIVLIKLKKKCLEEMKQVFILSEIEKNKNLMNICLAQLLECTEKLE